MAWSPITDLSPSDLELASDELRHLGQLWVESRQELEGSGALAQFTEQLSRRWAIETGLIERVYHLDRGVTQLLVEHGIDAARIPHSSVNRQDPKHVSAIIEDQLDAAEGLFDFVANKRSLSTSYIKELHQALTRHQTSTTAMTPEGRAFEVDLLRGQFKKLPNNPRRPDGTMHHYAPPEQVDSEIERLISMHLTHLADGVAPEIEAAWLHHRFTQIHPFQDGNGRIARTLASLVFLRAGMFLPVVRDDEDRNDYFHALEQADGGDLAPLVKLFVRLQKSALREALSVSNQVTDDQKNMDQVIAALSRDARRSSEAKAANQAERARQVAGVALTHARTRLDQIKEMITKALDPERFRIIVDFQPDGSEKSTWYRSDTVAAAKQFGYFANFDAYRGWVRLKLVDREEEIQDEVVVAVHGMGTQFRGGISAVAFTVRREPTADEGMREVSRVTLTDEPFSATYLDSDSAANQRLSSWLEPALLAAIDDFRRAVANKA
ncbi:MAG: Fic family protein [Propionibacteriaceae bacterium]|nr:Fic family protein [Propionibacteriaceae bacterium]